MSCQIYDFDALTDMLASCEKDVREKKRKEKKRKETLSGGRSAISQAGRSTDAGSLDNPSTESDLEATRQKAFIAHQRAMRNPHAARRNKLSMSHSKIFDDTKKSVELWKQQNIERMQRARHRKEAAFRKNWNQLHRGEGHELHLEWEHRLKVLDDEKLMRKRQLCRAWNENVYQPVMHRIKEEAHRLRTSGIHATRRQEYQNFLDATNKKGGLFLDEVDEAEYDPGVMNRLAPKIELKLDDPTLRPITKVRDEKLMVPDKRLREHLSMSGRNKYMLPLREWGDLHIKATPHGHFAAMHDKDENQEGRQIHQSAATRVTLKPGYFDHFNMPNDLRMMQDEWSARYGKGKACSVRPVDQLVIGDPDAPLAPAPEEL